MECDGVVLVEKLTNFQSCDHFLTLSTLGEVIIWTATSSSGIPFPEAIFSVLTSVEEAEVLEACVLFGSDEIHPNCFSLIWEQIISEEVAAGSERYRCRIVTLDISDSKDVVATWPGTIFVSHSRVRLMCVQHTGTWLITPSSIQFFDIKARQLENLHVDIADSFEDEQSGSLVDAQRTYLALFQVESFIVNSKVILHLAMDTTSRYFCYDSTKKKIDIVSEEQVFVWRSCTEVRPNTIASSMMAFLDADEFTCRPIEGVEDPASPDELSPDQQYLPGLPIDPFELMYYLSEPNLLEILSSIPESRRQPDEQEKISKFMRKLEHLYVLHPEKVLDFVTKLDVLSCESIDKRLYDNTLITKMATLANASSEDCSRAEEGDIAIDEDDGTWRVVPGVDEEETHIDAFPLPVQLDLEKVFLDDHELPPRLPRDGNLLLSFTYSCFNSMGTSNKLSDLQSGLLDEIRRILRVGGRDLTLKN